MVYKHAISTVVPARNPRPAGAQGATGGFPAQGATGGFGGQGSTGGFGGRCIFFYKMIFTQFTNNFC